MKTCFIPTRAFKYFGFMLLTALSLLQANDVQAAVSASDVADPPFNDRMGCQSLTFDFDGNGDPILAGQIIDATTYAALGVSIQGFANFGSGFVPNELVAFDSSNPSGGDDDLGTPRDPLIYQISHHNILIINMLCKF